MPKKDDNLKVKSLGDNLKKFKKDLKNLKTKIDDLEKIGLPKLNNPSQLASFLKIDVHVLMKYCIAKNTVIPSEFHYRRFKLKKKTGGVRVILAPKKELKSIQDKIYHEILEKIKPSSSSHGFQKDFSIVSNAKVHLNAELIYSLDLKNFFPSIKFQQVLEIFKRMGYSGLIASLLTALCTAPPMQYSKNKRKWILEKKNVHYLPQGAPTSPALSNLACIDLDEELDSIAKKNKFRYSRYADDLAFSSISEKKITKDFLNKIQKQIVGHGFSINQKKEYFSRMFKPRRVTGIIVHKDYLALPRVWIRRLRAALHELKNSKLDKDDPNFIELVKNIEGRCAYATMVNKKRYSHFYETFKVLKS